MAPRAWLPFVLSVVRIVGEAVSRTRKVAPYQLDPEVMPALPRESH